MSGLGIVGSAPVNPGDITNRLAVNNLINSLTPSRVSVAAQATALVDTTYASKVYVDNSHANYVAPTYYATQDALNLPLAAVGAANGAASTDASTKIPLSQMPNVGAGYIKGPWGPTATFAGTTDGTPLKIADWGNIGVSAVQFRPMVFLLAFVSGTFGQPIIEIRISNGTSAPADYASTTLIGQGIGIYGYNDFHTVAVIPAPDTTGTTPSLLAANYNVWITAWLYDLAGQSVTLASGGIASGSAYLLRGAQ